MPDKQSFNQGFMAALMLICFVFFAAGAVNFRTANVHYDLKAQQPLHLACSADGMRVFVADNNKVYFSANSGRDWEVVLAEKPDGKP